MHASTALLKGLSFNVTRKLACQHNVHDGPATKQHYCCPDISDPLKARMPWVVGKQAGAPAVPQVRGTKGSDTQHSPCL
eukprot:1136763-Pelagomonas_calceolata.AAC.1